MRDSGLFYGLDRDQPSVMRLVSVAPSPACTLHAALASPGVCFAHGMQAVPDSAQHGVSLGHVLHAVPAPHQPCALVLGPLDRGSRLHMCTRAGVKGHSSGAPHAPYGLDQPPVLHAVPDPAHTVHA